MADPAARTGASRTLNWDLITHTTFTSNAPDALDSLICGNVTGVFEQTSFAPFIWGGDGSYGQQVYDSGICNKAVFNESSWVSHRQTAGHT